MKNLFYRVLAFTLFLIFIVGCSSLYTGIVTFRDVRDTALKDWAKASHDGFSTPAIDKAVIAADKKVQQSAKVLEDALTAYKANGDKTQYQAALLAMRAAINDLIDLIIPIVTPSTGSHLKSLAAKASQ